MALRPLKQTAPEIVFHLAAQALVRQSYADPVATYAINCQGTAHLFDAVLEGRVLAMPNLNEQRRGVLVGLYRYMGEHVKAGLGYNFTSFSEDLTDMSFRHHGVFLNVVGAL